MMPVEIIQIIVDYIPDDSLPDIDIFEQVEKMLGSKLFKDVLLDCEKYNQCFCQTTMRDCNCQKMQQIQQQFYRCFTFHPNYPETFLARVMDEKLLGRHNTCVIAVSSEKEMIPFFINNGKLGKSGGKERTSKFLEKYASSFLNEKAEKEKKHKEKERERKITPITNHYSKSINFIKELREKDELVEEFINKELSTIHNLGGDNKFLVWREIVKNPNVSMKFLLHHLKEGNISEACLSSLSKHPSFLNNWSNYSPFFTAAKVRKTVERGMFGNLGEDFFIAFPDLFQSNLKSAAVSYNFFKNSNFFKSNFPKLPNLLKPLVLSSPENEEKLSKVECYYPRRYGFFENEYIGEEFIEEVLHILKIVGRQNNCDDDHHQEKEEKEEKNETDMTKEESAAAGNIIKALNTNTSLSEQFWERHIDLVRWGKESYFYEIDAKLSVPSLVFFDRKSTISRNPNLSISFIKKYKDRLNLIYVFRHNKLLPLYFLRQALVAALAGKI